MPTDVKEAIDITDRGSIKSVILERSNMGFKSYSTGKNARNKKRCGRIAQTTSEPLPR